MISLYASQHNIVRAVDSIERLKHSALVMPVRPQRNSVNRSLTIEYDGAELFLGLSNTFFPPTHTK